MARGARPRCRRPRLERGRLRRRLRLDGVRLRGGGYPRVLRSAHVHAPGSIPHGVQHPQGGHGPLDERAARLFRQQRERPYPQPVGRSFGRNRDAARTQPGRHRGHRDDARRHDSAHVRVRLAYGRCLPGGRRHLRRIDVRHDGRKERQAHGRVPGRAGPHEQGGDGIRARHPRGEGVPADGLFLQSLQGSHRRLQCEGEPLPRRRLPRAPIGQPHLYRRGVRLLGSCRLVPGAGSARFG